MSGDAPLFSALEALPLFPLPDVVLLPGQILPLHVFEPRYRVLVADLLPQKRLLAIPRLRPGYEKDYEGRPPVFDVAGMGYIIADQRLPDGRYHIVVRGVGRVRLLEELPPTRAYREVRAELLVDTRPSRPAEMPSQHAQILALCDRLASHLDAEGDALRKLARASSSPSTCVDLVAAAVVTSADDRQMLLETLDPSERMDRVLAYLASILARFGPGSSAWN